MYNPLFLLAAIVFVGALFGTAKEASKPTTDLEQCQKEFIVLRKSIFALDPSMQRVFYVLIKDFRNKYEGRVDSKVLNDYTKKLWSTYLQFEREKIMIAAN